MIVFFYYFFDFEDFPSFSSIASILLAILVVVSMWIIFVKLKKPGWYALIPFFNTFMLFSSVWGKKKGVVLLVLEGCSIAIYLTGAITLELITASLYYQFFGSGFNLIGLLALLYNLAIGGIPLSVFVGFACVLLGIIIAVVVYLLTMVGFVKLGRSFGKKGLFLIGMFVLPFIFMPILAIGKSVFLGSVNGHNPNLNYPFIFEPNAYYPEGYDESMNDRYKRLQAK